MSVSLIWIAGCGSENSNQAANAKSISQAISYAIRVFERYSGSQALSDKTQFEITFVALPGQKNISKIKSIQQKISKLTSEQQKDFDEALQRLEEFINEASSEAEHANTLAIAKALAGQFHLYNGYWLIDNVQRQQIRQIQTEMKIHELCMQMNSLKAEKEMLKPAIYQTVIAKTESAIKAMEQGKAITSKQLKDIKAALEELNSKLSAVIRQRDALNLKIGELTRKMDIASAKQAVVMQKKINALENKRFEILTIIQKLRTGPYTLDKPIDVSFLAERQILKTIGGIEQLQQEQKRLQTRLAKINDAIKLQREYLKNIKSQMKIALNKSTIVAKQLDDLAEQLKSQLNLLADAAKERNDVAQKANAELIKAIKLSKEAKSDAQKYLSAIKQAASNISASGRTDNFLQEAAKTQNLTYSIDNIFIDALLLQAKLLSENISYIKRIANILKHSDSLVAAPKQLTDITKQANTNITKLLKERQNAIEQAIKTSQANAKSVRGDIAATVKTQYAVTLYQAAIIIPEQKEEYIGKAKSILNELLSGKANTDDVLLAPAKALAKQLKL